MTEAWEIAERIDPPPHLLTFESIRAWLIERWPNWNEWHSVQMFDNIVEELEYRNQVAAKMAMELNKKSRELEKLPTFGMF